MATLALAVGAAVLSSSLGLTAAAAAGSIAASIGIAAIGAVASIVGGIIDSYLFAPHQKQEGPRLNELQVQGSTEGQPLSEVWGMARISGQMIWATRFKEVVSTETTSAGSKGGALGGGGKVTTTTYDYYMSMAFGVARRITEWGRIWADGKIAYREASASEESITSTSISFHQDVSGVNGADYILVPSSGFSTSIPSVDVGVSINVSGTTSNDGSYNVTEVKDYELNQKQLLVEGSLVNEAAGASVTIDVDELTSLDELNSPTFYYGGPWQEPDAQMEAIQGEGNTPAYKQCAYVMMYEVPLKRFGNRVPNFVFEIENEPGPYTWDDIFTDQRARGGENWTGYGYTEAKPAQEPLEWFMRNILPEKRPWGAVINLTSPTGVIHLRGWVHPPPASQAKGWTLDLTGNIIERGADGSYAGQLHLWGDLVSDPALPTPATVGVDAYAGDTTVTLRDDEDAVTFFETVVVGSVVQFRTNATAPDYHPTESRATGYISGLNPLTKTITLARPLEIDLPRENPVGDFPDETYDPTTINLLVASMIAADADGGDNQITLVDASKFDVGDWCYLSTSELFAPGACQFTDGGSDDLDITIPQEYGETLINEEMLQIASKSGNTITFTEGMGKNKLIAWNAACIKVDPMEDCKVIGGKWLGYESYGSFNPWQHQYIWARYGVNCDITDAEFDTDPSRARDHRRMGQAVRFDTGDNSIAQNLNIGQGAGIAAGEAYGISLRRGERNSTVKNCTIDKCRHSVEFWSTSGGCAVDGCTCTNDTSSSIDTHGLWNVKITIKNNTIKRDPSSEESPDLGGLTDAIRIGNNKFILDEDIDILNNTVVDYYGQCVSIVPGSRKVTVDGLDCDNVLRILNIGNNTRHANLFVEDIIVRNVTGDNIKDRICEVNHGTDLTIAKNLTLENWTIGASGLGTIDDPDINNIRILDAVDVTLTNVSLLNVFTKPYNYDFWFYNLNNLTLNNIFGNGGERGASLIDVTNVSGTAEFQNLESGTPLLIREDGTCSGSLTVTHDQGGSPSFIVDNISLTTVP